MPKKRVKPRRKWVFFILRNQSTRKLTKVVHIYCFLYQEQAQFWVTRIWFFKPSTSLFTLIIHYITREIRDMRKKNISVISLYIFHACFLKKEVVEVMEVIPVILHIVTTYLLHILISMKAYIPSIGSVAHLQSIDLRSERGGFESRHCRCLFLGSMHRNSNFFL